MRADRVCCCCGMLLHFQVVYRHVCLHSWLERCHSRCVLAGTAHAAAGSISRLGQCVQFLSTLLNRLCEALPGVSLVRFEVVRLHHAVVIGA